MASHHRVVHRPASRFGRETGLLVLAAFAVCAVVVLGVLLLGTPTIPPETPPRTQPATGTSIATIELDENGDVGSASIELTTDEPSLHLSVPSRTGLAARFDPQVTAIRVIAASSVIEVDPIAPGEIRTVELPAGTSDVRVEFAATDTYSATTSGDRGLTLLTPLAIEEAAGDDWTVEVADQRVLNVACVAGEEMTTCANAPDGVWVAEPDEGMDVVAQVRLD